MPIPASLGGAVGYTRKTDQRDSARKQECRTNEREDGGTTLAETEQQGGGSTEGKGEVCDAEKTGETGERPREILHVRFDEKVQ